MYKLIVLDCDGTLLNSQKEISYTTLSTIKGLVSKGVRVVIASARPFYRLKPYLNIIGTVSDDQYTISFNGGLITNNTDTNTILSKGFQVDEIRDIISYGESIGTKIFLYAKNEVFSNFNDLRYQRKNPDVVFNVVNFNEMDFSHTEIYKIVYVNDPEITQVIRNNIPHTMFEKYEISSSVPQFVEFVSKGITKAMALDIISHKIGVDRNEIIAFGDEDNDIPMLEYAGYSIAMNNSSDNVKEIADYTTASNDEDGVAQALGLFFQ